MSKSFAIVITLLGAGIIAAGLIGAGIIITSAISTSIDRAISTSIDQGQQQAAKAAAEKKAAEEKADAWELDRARFFIKQFTYAVSQCDGVSIYGFLTNEYRDRLPLECQEAKSVVYCDRGEKFQSTFASSGKTLSPTRDSLAVNVSIVSGITVQGQEKTLKYSFYAVKDKQSGSWRVDAVEIPMSRGFPAP